MGNGVTGEILQENFGFGTFLEICNFILRALDPPPSGVEDATGLDFGDFLETLNAMVGFGVLLLAAVKAQGTFELDFGGVLDPEIGVTFILRDPGNEF